MPPIPPPRESGYTTTTPFPLYWVSYGEQGAEPVLVLHGGPGASHEYLLPQMLRLSGTTPRDLRFYDQRGGGRSRHDEDRGAIGWRDQVEDVGRVVRELGVEPLTIVGFSWGGLLALLYTIEAAEGRAAGGPLPRRLVLLDPAPITRAWRDQFEAEFSRRQQDPVLQTMRTELAASGLREEDPEAYRHRVFELSVAGYFADPRNARDLTPFRVVGRVQQSIWQSLGDYDLRPSLRELGTRHHLPTIVFHGRQDPIPLASSAAVAEALGAKLEILEPCGHVPYVEQPEALFAGIERFLGGGVSV